MSTSGRKLVTLALSAVVGFVAVFVRASVVESTSLRSSLGAGAFGAVCMAVACAFVLALGGDDDG